MASSAATSPVAGGTLPNLSYSPDVVGSNILFEGDANPSSATSPEQVESIISERDQKAAEFDEEEVRKSIGSDGEGKNEERIIVTGEDVSNILISDRDDGDPCLTLRSITLGTVCCIFAGVMTQLYNFKPTQVSISGTFLTIIIWVLGSLWALVLPTRASLERRGYDPDSVLVRAAHILNPGPFGIKELATASIAASSSTSGGHAVVLFSVQKLFYPGIPVTATNAVLSILSISCFGFGLAGLLRPITVYPAQMVFWGTLPQVDLFQALNWSTHGKKTQGRRVRLFWISLTGMLMYQTIPAYIMPWLNSVSIPCLAAMHAPQRYRSVLNNVFGGSTSNQGLGLVSMSFDWQYISSSQLAYPLIQQANSWIGYSICAVAMLAIYYSDTWNAKSFPFMSSALFTPDGKPYPRSSVFVNGILDRQKLQEVGFPNVSGAFAWGMLATNLAVGGLIAHVVLFWGRDTVRSIKQSRTGTQPDRHFKAMQKYSEAPWWWYVFLMGISFILGLIVVIKENTTLPVWGYIMALMVGSVIAPFSTILYAMLGTGISTNQLTKMIAGVLHPGRPLANMYFYSWSHATIAQTVNLSNDLKIAQYVKIPPRIMFAVQIVSTILGAGFNYLIADTIIKSKFNFLIDGNGNNVWSGAYFQGLNSAAITWSMARFTYGPGTPYFIIPMSIFIGAAFVILHRIYAFLKPYSFGYPSSDLVLPTVFLYMGQLTQGQNCVVLSTVLVGFISQVIVRRRFPRVFKNYNYVLGAGLDGGSLFVIFILSFAVFGAAGTAKPFPTWFGNPTGYTDHCPQPAAAS
ncbi:OPT superfamily oligopeptide transporter [Violaceomyces palustris]|uniref:OPT superfamily oligopeptide transporter n=1 Tax=Violaceomyces palustris TaxID=1673888 RepID=A0ACD0NQN8_9BASI|nr:OPT superfamily oligopeptide transporter [Violaceomyces palustris]